MAGQLFLAANLATSAIALAPTSQDERAYVATYKCEIAARIARIHASPTPKFRYIVVSPKNAPGNYVQCLFVEDDARMLCEAASGYYAKPASQSPSPIVSPDGLLALSALGFSTDGSEGNFQRFSASRSPDDFGAIAELLLSALYEGYGARLPAKLEVIAPLGRFHRAMRGACARVS